MTQGIDAAAASAGHPLTVRVAERICQTLLAPPPSDTLAAMTAIRTEFMQNKLPGLLEGLPPQRARKLTSEVNAMLHEFISVARREP